MRSAGRWSETWPWPTFADSQPLEGRLGNHEFVATGLEEEPDLRGERPAPTQRHVLPEGLRIECRYCVEICRTLRHLDMDIRRLPGTALSNRSTGETARLPIGNVVESGVAQRQTASEYLKALCWIGVLQERKAGRETLFINPRLLRLLTTGTQP
jgi:Protein adenylyltransferase SoFic-like, C-terminal domain